MNDILRFRQIHLDFHTHGSIDGIAAEFDSVEFARTLSLANVDSINLFARCHHGYLYYDSKRFPERRHPGLQSNLLAEQIAACHSHDIKAPVYISVQWDAFSAEQHPEWLVRAPDGRVNIAAFDAGFYNYLCLNTAYVDFLKDLVDEVFETLPVDGLWFDILLPIDCACSACLRIMREEKLNPEIESVRRQFGLDTLTRFKREMTRHIRERHPECRIFYNSGHVGPQMRRELDSFSHLELESLPSGAWGYTHFPATVRYARTLGHDFLGMTGKFHTSWGDFHSFKNPEALTYECFTMLAHNAKCCVGDQLHPRGKICQTTYELIGSIFREIKACEPWCVDAVAVTDIGVLTPEEFGSGGELTSLPKAILGATRMLQELHHQFDIIDSQTDFSSYKILILPDEIPVNEVLAQKLAAHLKSGGKILASHRAGLGFESEEFRIPCGLTYKGKSEFAPLFIRPRQLISDGLKVTEYVMYLGGSKVTAQEGTEILADSIEPYFNRTWKHYCSHLHAPSSGLIEGPAAAQRDGVIYFSNPLFTQYEANAPQWCRTLLRNALIRLLPQPVLKTNGPTTLTTALNWQLSENRLVLHLLHYVPVRTSATIDIIDQTIPIHDLTCSLRVDRLAQAVICVPEGKSLPFSYHDGRVSFTLPLLNGRQMIEIRLA